LAGAFGLVAVCGTGLRPEVNATFQRRIATPFFKRQLVFGLVSTVWGQPCRPASAGPRLLQVAD